MSNSNIFVGTQVDSTDLNDLLNEQDELQIQLGAYLNKIEIGQNILETENKYLKSQIETQNIERGIIKQYFTDTVEELSNKIVNISACSIYQDISMLVPLNHTYLRIDDNQNLGNLLTFVCTNNEDGFMHSIFDTDSKSYKFTYYTNNQNMRNLKLLGSFEPFECNIIAFNYSEHVYISLISNGKSADGDTKLVFDAPTEISTLVADVTFDSSIISNNINERFGMFKYFVSFEIKDIHIGKMTTEKSLNLDLYIDKYTSDTLIETMGINSGKNDYVYYENIKYNISDSAEKLAVKNYSYSGIITSTDIINCKVSTLSNSSILYLNLKLSHAIKPIILFDISTVYNMRG